MIHKKSLLVFCLVICILFSVSTVMAADINDDAIASEDSSNMLEQANGEEAVPSIGIENEQITSEIDSSQLNAIDDSAPTKHTSKIL